MRTVHFTFGRMNPLTKGHAKLINTILQNSVSDDHKIFLSRTQDNDNNPLSWEHRKYLIEKVFGRINIVDDTEIKTPYQALKYLCDQYDDIVFYAGDDRIGSYLSMNKYAIEWGAKRFEIISSGFRSNDSVNIEGVSASKARDFVKSNDFTNFKLLLPDQLSESSKWFVYRKIQHAQKVLKEVK